MTEDNAERPFQAGFDTRLVASLAPSQDGLPFQPAATHQGVVVSMPDAEWLLIRTAARLQERQGHASRTRAADLGDRRALSEALADACGLTPAEVLRRLAPRIRQRVETIEHGVANAAAMGREHGLTGAEPYCRLDENGHDGRLMRAFGETETTTDANALHRLALIQAYTSAYSRTRKDSAPAQLAEHDFPQQPQTFSCADGSHASGPTEAASPARAWHPRKTN